MEEGEGGEDQEKEEIGPESISVSLPPLSFFVYFSTTTEVLGLLQSAPRPAVSEEFAEGLVFSV